jgi:carbonic anhydrase/acetyltransferase-like protein (isoleucine patch superfamily)
MVYSLESQVPQIDPDAWVAPGACVIGSVTLEANVSVWFNAVLRGDNDRIHVGRDTSVQENAVLHTDPGLVLSVGDNCTIGHMVMLHGCTVGRNTLVGIKAVVLNRAVIGENCLIGANSLITEGKVIPPGSLVMGSPGRVVRPLTVEEIASLTGSAQYYVNNARRYRAMLRPV